MLHNISLISTIVASLELALIMRLPANCLKLPVLLDCLLAGILLLSLTPGFADDAARSVQLAEMA